MHVVVEREPVEIGAPIARLIDRSRLTDQRVSKQFREALLRLIAREASTAQGLAGTHQHSLVLAPPPFAALDLLGLGALMSLRGHGADLDSYRAALSARKNEIRPLALGHLERKREPSSPSEYAQEPHCALALAG